MSPRFFLVASSEGSLFWFPVERQGPCPNATRHTDLNLAPGFQRRRLADGGGCSFAGAKKETGGHGAQLGLCESAVRLRRQAGAKSGARCQALAAKGSKLHGLHHRIHGS